jgi:hypothetical protein
MQELQKDRQRYSYKPFYLPVGVMLKEEQQEKSAALTGVVAAH